MKAKLAEAEGRLLCSKCQGDMLPNKDGVYEFETFRPGYSGTVHSYLYSLVVTVFVIFIYWFLLHFTRCYFPLFIFTFIHKLLLLYSVIFSFIVTFSRNSLLLFISYYLLLLSLVCYFHLFILI